MNRVFERLRRNHFAILGRVGMDLYADPPGTRIEQARAFTSALGGSAGNIAAALARQGAAASMISCVSDDAVGRFCLEELKRYGVDVRHVRAVRGEARNSLAVVETRPIGAQTVLYRNGAADFALTTADIDAIDFSAFAALIVTGTALALDPSRQAAFAALNAARAGGAVTVLDIDYRAYSWTSAEVAAETCRRAAECADIVIGNDEEFGFIAGGLDKGFDYARDLGRRDKGFAVYKKGPEGAMTITPDGEFETPIFPVKALKPMGAGDGFMGGLMAALAAGHPLPEAVRRGAATAAIIVSGIGCAPVSPTLTELDLFIARYTPD